MKTLLRHIGSGFTALLFSAFWAAGLFGYAQINIFEPCTNSTAVNPNVILAGDAYFTSGIDDPSGAGYLRLTKAANYQTGSVYINQSFSSTTGVVVEFEYWSWGPSPQKADGISVFLFDGTYGQGTFAFGGYGAGLGYGETSAPYATMSGLTGGYVAVGLDEFGNWRTKLNAYDNTAPTTSSGVIVPNISIRGRTADHTPYLSGILMSSQPFTLQYPTNTSVRPAASQYYRKFQVAILYNASINKYQVSVSVQTSVGGSMQRIISPYTMNTPPPATLKAGLASGTGAYNANHEIRNLRISSPGDVRVEKTGSASVTNGNTTSYTVTVYNDSPIDLNGITFKDILPTGFIPDAGTPSFNNGGNAGNTLVSGGYAGNVYDAVLNIKQNDSCSLTFSGKFNVVGDTTVTNTAIVKTPMGYTDTDLSNDTAHFATFVLGVPIIPQALQYIACPGANVTMGVFPQNGVSFYWYSAQAGGTALNASSSNTYTAANVSPPQTFWVEPRIGSTVYGRIPITISLSNSCGGTPVDCAVNGTLIFKEDFDKYGNGLDPASQRLSIEPLPTGRTTYQFTSASDPNDGWYALAKYNDNYNTGDPYWWSIGDDNTSPNNNTIGRFMLVNADYQPKVFYSHRIENLCFGSKFYFSVMVANCHLAPYSGNPDLSFSLLNTSTNEVIVSYNTGMIPEATKISDWRQWGFDFVLPANIDTVILEIKNNASGGGANDLGIDDIEIRLCVPPVTITVPSSSDTAVCIGSSVTLVGTYTDDGTFGNTLTYRWEYSLTGDISNPAAWTTKTTSTGTNPLNATYSIPFVSASDTGYYRLLVGNAASINQPNCRAASKPVRLGLSSAASLLIPIHDTICPNIAYTKHGFNISASELSVSGTVEFRDTISNPTGCDSVIVLSINVNPLYAPDSVEIYDTICPNIAYAEHGFDIPASKLQTAGMFEFRDTIPNPTGCHTLKILHLTVFPISLKTLQDTVCPYTSYAKHGFNISASELQTAGTYEYHLTLSNTRGCDSIVTLELTVVPSYDLVLYDTICQHANYYQSGFYIPSSDLSTLGNFSYQRSLSSMFACDSVVTLNLEVVEPFLRIEKLTDDFCEQHTAILEAVTNLKSVLWSTGSTEKQVTVNKSGDYMLTAHTYLQCKLSANIKIEECNYQLFLPNTITPSNHDGLNDFFSLPLSVPPQITEASIGIYDRWGERVFFSTDMFFKWDGRVNGQLVINTVYSYRIVARFLDGTERTFDGHITVL